MNTLRCKLRKSLSLLALTLLVHYMNAQSYCQPTLQPDGVTEPISLVLFGSINNETTPEISTTVPHYEDFSSVQTTVLQGQEYILNIAGNTNGNNTNYLTVYIDWDQDGIFTNSASQNEKYELPTSITNSTGDDAQLISFPIIIPQEATIGITRMRIIKNADSYATDPCNDVISAGQIEDYSLNVLPPLVSNDPVGVYYGDCAAITLNSSAEKAILVSGIQNNNNGGFLGLYKLGQNGTFSDAQAFLPVSNSAIAVADLNNDGLEDFVISGTNTDISTAVTYIYYNNGQGGFTQDNTQNIAGTSFGSIAIGDVNNDGHKDILVNGTAESGYISKLYLQDNTGNFHASSSYFMGTYFSDVKMLDINNDSYLDILITGFNNSYVSGTHLYLNNTDGTFTELTTTGLEGVRFSSVDTCDINNDGFVDILINGFTTAAASGKLYLNNGDNTFSDANAGFAGVYFGDATFVDVNNDGFMDIFEMGLNDNVASKNFYINDGTGSFSTNTTYLPDVLPVSTSRHLWIDANTDGYMDLFAAGLSDNIAYSKLYLNTVPDCFPQFEYNSDGNMITRVLFNTIDNISPFTSGTTPDYEDFRAIITPVNQGETYTISVKGPSSTFPSDVMAYIDFNQNNSFEDEGESFYIGRLEAANPANAHTITANITIPLDAVAGHATLRIIKNTNVAAYSDDDAENSIEGPCASNLRAGQVEEYMLDIQETDGNTVCDNVDPGENTGDTGCITLVYNGQTVSYTTVRAADGNIWLQQNLGSEQVALTFDDQDGYGDLFQWGRWNDGHQLRNSTVSNTLPSPNNPAGLNGQEAFFASSESWWSGNLETDTWTAENPENTDETNGCDPCKQLLGSDWQLPTQQDWQTIKTEENITNPASAFASSLKLPATGHRSSTSGEFTFVGERGYYWSSTTSSLGGKYFYVGSTIANPSAGAYRGQGSAIRCIKQAPLPVEVSAVEITTEGNVPAIITEENGTLQLIATITPVEANQSVTWSVESGAAYISVDVTGIATGIAEGTATIRATSLEDNTKFDEIELEVILEDACNPVETFLYTFNDFTTFPEQCWDASHSSPMFNLTENQDKTVQFYSFMNGTDDFYMVSPPVSTIDGEHALQFDIITSSENMLIQVGTLDNQTNYNGFISAGSLITPEAGNTYTSVAIPVVTDHKYVALRIIPNGDHKSLTIDNVTWNTTSSLSANEYEEQTFSVYPNPVQNTLHIQSTSPIEYYELFNALGQLQLSGNTNQVNCSDLEHGAYWLRVVLEDGQIVTRKVVKN